MLNLENINLKWVLIMKWINKLQRFMYGRYGVDELYRFLFILYILTFIVNMFVRSQILEIVSLIIVLITFYRVFSKNIVRRRKENMNYLKVKKAITRPINNIKRNINDKDHIYKKCSKCKTTLKLPIPYEIGIKHTKCPKCRKRISFLVLKRQKIEIIKKKK